MILQQEGPIYAAVLTFMGLMVFSILLTLLRLLIGPSLANRVVALNLMSTLSVGVIAIYAIAADEPIFLDVGSALALISFLGTVAFARYIELRRSSDE